MHKRRLARTTAAVAAVGVVGALFTGGVTYALWRDSAEFGTRTFVITGDDLPPPPPDRGGSVSWGGSEPVPPANGPLELPYQTRRPDNCPYPMDPADCGPMGGYGSSHAFLHVDLRCVSHNGDHEPMGQSVHQTLAVDADGVVWSWGDPWQGALGRPWTDANRNVPTPLPSNSFTLPGDLNHPDVEGGFVRATAVDAGFMFSVALDELGRVWAWGSNNNWELGQAGQPTSPNPPPGGIRAWDHPGQANLPVLVNFPHEPGAEPPTIVAISVGSQHSLSLTSEGHIYTWGLAFRGLAPNGNAIVQRSTPFRVPLNDYHTGRELRATAIEASIVGRNVTDHQINFAIIEDGNIYGWGFNGNAAAGFLGIGERRNLPPNVGVVTATATQSLTGGYRPAAFHLTDQAPLSDCAVGLGDETPATELLPGNSEMHPAAMELEAALPVQADAYEDEDQNGEYGVAGDPDLPNDSLPEPPPPPTPPTCAQGQHLVGLECVNRCGANQFYLPNADGDGTCVDACPASVPGSEMIPYNGVCVPACAAGYRLNPEGYCRPLNCNYFDYMCRDWFNPIPVGPGIESGRLALDGVYRAVSVTSTQGRTFALSEDGHIYAWGENDTRYRWLGLQGARAGDAFVDWPTSVTRTMPPISPYPFIEVNAANATALNANGEVYTWGAHSGREEHPAPASPTHPTRLVCGHPTSTNPCPPVFGGYPVVSISGGASGHPSYSTAITSNGDIYVWGQVWWLQGTTTAGGESVGNWRRAPWGFSEHGVVPNAMSVVTPPGCNEPIGPLGDDNDIADFVCLDVSSQRDGGGENPDGPCIVLAHRHNTIIRQFWEDHFEIRLVRVSEPPQPGPLRWAYPGNPLGININQVHLHAYPPRIGLSWHTQTGLDLSGVRREGTWQLEVHRTNGAGNGIGEGRNAFPNHRFFLNGWYLSF